MAASVDFRDQAQRIGAETSRGIRLRGIHDVDQVVGHALACGRVGLGGADVHAAIDLRRIDAHDFHRQSLGKGQGRRRLAARRGAEQEDRLHRPRMKSRSSSAIES